VLFAVLNSLVNTEKSR